MNVQDESYKSGLDDMGRYTSSMIPNAGKSSQDYGRKNLVGLTMKSYAYEKLKRNTVTDGSHSTRLHHKDIPQIMQQQSSSGSLLEQVKTNW